MHLAHIFCVLRYLFLFPATAAAEYMNPITPLLPQEGGRWRRWGSTMDPILRRHEHPSKTSLHRARDNDGDGVCPSFPRTNNEERKKRAMRVNLFPQHLFPPPLAPKAPYCEEAKQAAKREAASAHGGLDSVLLQMEKAKKLNVLDKSKMDWKEVKEGDAAMEEDLEKHKKGKTYLEQQDFLKRAELREYEIERDARLAGDVRSRGRL